MRGTGTSRRFESTDAPTADRGAIRELTYEPVDASSGLPFPTRAELPDLPGASYIDTAIGRAIVVDHVFEADSFHGRVRLERATLAASAARALAEGVPAPVAEAGASPVFLDLETTGLSGGAGTVAFLVGIGFFEDGAFRTRQFLLPGFSAERILLEAVSEVLDAAPALVTYNGKTFDLPVMETRWAFHRLSPPWEETPHLDMLHLARRLWKSRAERMGDPGCRLVTLERDLFGASRVGDCSGFEIPARYFDYIRRGDAGVLAPVLHHNRLDLLSLACLAARADALLRDGSDAAADPDERLAVGREYMRRGTFDEAERCLRAVIGGSGQAQHRSDRGGLDQSGHVLAAAIRVDALFCLARLLRRQRRHDEAREVWRALASTGWAKAAVRYEAQRALAVHHEHRACDLDGARSWAIEALDTAPPRERDAVVHRMARIERKRAGRSLGATPSLFADLLLAES